MPPPLERSERPAPIETSPVVDRESSGMRTRSVARRQSSAGSATGEVFETLAIAVILFFAMRLLVLPVKVEGTKEPKENQPTPQDR
jgi:hypothetical protein